MSRPTLSACLVLVVLCLAAGIGGNAPMSDYGVGPVDDRRCSEIRHLDMTYSFAAPDSKKAWDERARHLREQILTGCGLLPMPEKSPLNARVFGRIEREGYSIEKVYFESFPGLYVTGNLYRPLGKKGPFPAILNTHGHWAEGRIVNNDSSDIPGRCANFARQGYIAFSYDMIGFNDSTQVEHRKGQLDGARAHLWGISIGGIQLWNSIRAVDFLLSLADVDKKRIACTGASGGGTQTFMLTAVDDRIRYAAPVNMISSTMQGGCQCENPPLIRLDTNNMEIGALAAPRPLLLVSATGDWTAKTPTVEFPAIKSVYKLLSLEDRVECVQFDAGHNYNKDSREAVYAFFGRWMLGNSDGSAFKEQPTEDEKPEDLLVFARDPRPVNALHDSGIIESRVEAAEKQIEAMRPRDAAGLKAFREVYGPALRHCLAVEYPAPDGVEFEHRGEFDAGDSDGAGYVISRKGKGDAIPALFFCSDSGPLSSPLTLIVHPQGKAGLLEDGQPGPLIRRFLDAHHRVLVIDCFNTGEHLCPEDRTTKYAFFGTYNRTDIAERVQDILTALSFLDTGPAKPAEMQLVGIGEAGLWCMLARAFAPGVERTVVDADGFGNTDDQAFVEKLFVPSLRRAGDFRAAGTLIAPGHLLIHNTKRRFKTDWIEDAYRSLGSSQAFEIHAARVSDAGIVDRLTTDYR